MRFKTRPVEIWSAQVAEVLTAVKGMAFVAGGAARHLCLEDFAPPAEDIDLFLLDKRHYDPCCAVLRGLGYRPVEVSENAVSFEPRDASTEVPVQVIRPYRDELALTYGTHAEVLSHFSFTTEMFAILGDAVLYGENSIDDTLSRRLVIHNVNDPVMVGIRVCKYAAKGYTADAAALIRLFREWEQRPSAWKQAARQQVHGVAA